MNTNDKQQQLDTTDEAGELTIKSDVTAGPWYLIDDQWHCLSDGSALCDQLAPW